MKLTKKLLATILAAVMLFSAAPIAGIAMHFTAAAAEGNPNGTCGKNITWELDLETGNLILKGTGEIFNYKLTSPSPWVSGYKDFVKTVFIGDGITGIGNYAFASCAQLKAAVLGKDVRSIGNAAFMGCTSLCCWLKYDNLPDYYKNVELNCQTAKEIVGAIKSALNSITLLVPETVVDIGLFAFARCDGIQVLSTSARNIGGLAFWKCSNLTLAIIGAQNINSQAFSECNKLTSIMMTQNVRTIGGHAFDFDYDELNVSYAGTEQTYDTFVLRGEMYNEYFDDDLNNKAISFTGNENATPKYGFSDKLIWSPTITSIRNKIANVDITISGSGEMTEAPWLDYVLSEDTPKINIQSVTFTKDVTKISGSNYKSFYSEEKYVSGPFEGCNGLMAVNIQNKNAVIDDDVFTNPGMTICGCIGSTAQKYANEHSLRFVNICEGNNSYTIDKKETCTAVGQKSIHCKYCDAVMPGTVEVIPAKGHTWTEKITAATCTESGEKHECCSDCNEIKPNSSTVIPAKGHNYSTVLFNRWTVKRAATCTEPGLEEGRRRCKTCKNYETRTIAAKGHSWSSSYTVDVTATCTAEGSKSIHCTSCSATKNSIVIPKTNHSYGEWSTVNPAACTKDGIERRECSCGNAEERAIPATGHSYGDWTEVRTATCTANGLKKHECSCGEAEELEVPALGHIYGDWSVVSPATCINDGLKKRECAACKEAQKEKIAAIGHEWENGYTVDVKASCTKTGSKSVHCKNCDEKKNVTVIPKESHTFGEWKVEGSVQSRYCTKCNLREERPIPTCNHSYGEWTVIRQATCEQEGERKRTCRCGDTQTETIEKSEHTAATDKAVAPTCTQTGLTEGSHCAKCKITLTEQNIVDMLPHSYGEWTVSREATCEQEGEKKHTCRCGDTQTKATEKTGHTAVTDKAVAPTCAHIGLTEGSHCSKCMAVFVKQEIIPAVDHAFGSWYTEQEPAVGHEGCQKRKCTCCSFEESETLPAVELSINKTALTISNGNSEVIKTNSTNVIWSSSNETIAKVDENGKVTAIKRGVAIITAKDCLTGAFVSCTVTVTLNAMQRFLNILFFGLLF